MDSALAFEELDYLNIPIGELSLRRRTLLCVGAKVYEGRLGDDCNPLQDRLAGHTIHVTRDARDAR